MRTLRPSLVGAVILALLAGTGAAIAPAPTRAANAEQPVFETPGVGPGLIVGDAARQEFEALRNDGAVSFTDFEDVPTGLHRRLAVRGPGGDFEIVLRTTLMRWPLPPRHPKGAPVAMLPYDFVTEPANHRLMGVVVADVGKGKSKYYPDGQSRFELTIDPPASHVGLSRPWNTNSVTNLFRADGTLLESHRNTTMNEFVGYVAATPWDRVGRIEVDGIPEQPDDEYNQLFQVGQVDDLFLGNGPAGASDAGAVLPPLDPRIGVTDAGAPPGPTDRDASTDRTAEPDPAGQPVPVSIGEVDLGPLSWFELLVWIGAIADRDQVPQATRDEIAWLLKLFSLLLEPDHPAEDAPTPDLDAPDDTPGDPPQSAFDALADGMDAGPGTFAGVPPGLKPEQQKRMETEGRVWVQLPDSASIDTGKSKVPKVTLKTATWYQVKIEPNGTQVFYDKKGKLLGQNRSPDRVQVRVWVPQEEKPKSGNGQPR